MYDIFLFDFLMLIVKLCSNKVNKSFITPFLNVSMTVVITSTMNIALLTSCLCILILATISETRNVYMAHTEPSENTVTKMFRPRCFACHGNETRNANGEIWCPQRCVEKSEDCEYVKCFNLNCKHSPMEIPDVCKK